MESGLFLTFLSGGLIVGAFAGEYLKYQNFYQVWRTAWGAFVGFLTC